MPRQHQRVLPRPHWRSRLAGWLRGFAESLDPAPDGLDLTGAPDFWAEHVRAAARRARKEGRAFRMRRWGVAVRSAPDIGFAERGPDEPPARPEASAPPAGRAPVAPPGRRSTPSARASTARASTPHDPPAGYREMPRVSAESPRARAGGWVAPLVRPRPARRPGEQPPTTQAPGRPDPLTQPQAARRGRPPLVRPRPPVASRPAPPEPQVPPEPGIQPGRAVPGWPEAERVPDRASRAESGDWFGAPDLPEPAGSGWPADPLKPAPRREAARTARVQAGEVERSDELPPLSVPQRREARQLVPEAPAESRWPELPVRRPPVPVVPDPAPILLRRQRLAAEQAAT